MKWLWVLLPFSVMWAEFFFFFEVMPDFPLTYWWDVPAMATMMAAQIVSFFIAIHKVA